MSSFLGGGGSGGGGSSLTVGSTPVSGGTTSFALTDNAGVLGDAAIRTVLLADTTYDVNSATGVDAPGPGPYKTLHFAYTYLTNILDGNGFILTIQCQGAGPYTMDAETGWVGMQQVNILGDGSSVTEFSNLTFGWNNTFNLGCTVYVDSCRLSDTGINPVAPSVGCCLWTEAGGALGISGINGDVTVSPSANADFKSTGPDAQIQLYGTITFLPGTRTFEFYVGFYGSIGNASNIVQSGTPVFDACIFVTEGALFNDFMGANSYSGAATGMQYQFVTGGLYTGDSTVISGSVPGVLLQEGHDPVAQDHGAHAIVTPATGNTVTMAWLTTTLIIKPAGALLALTIDLPPIPVVSNPFGYAVNFQEFDISTTQAVTTVTWVSPDSKTIANGFPSAFTAGQQLFPKYDAGTSTWYP